MFPSVKLDREFIEGEIIEKLVKEIIKILVDENLSYALSKLILETTISALGSSCLVREYK